MWRFLWCAENAMRCQTLWSTIHGWNLFMKKKKNVMSYNIVKEFDGLLFVPPQYYFILHDHNYSVMPAMTSCKLRSFIFCSWVENRPKIIWMGIATQLHSTRRDRIRFIRTKRNQTILILQLLDVRSIRDSWRWINIYTNIF